MHVLMITRDEEVLRDGSPSRSAIHEKARAAKRLYVLVMNSRKNFARPRKVNDNLWLFPTNSWVPFLKIFDALYLVRHEIFYRNRLQADVVSGEDPLLAGFVAVLVARIYKTPLHVHCGRNLFANAYRLHSFTGALRSVIARLIVGRAFAVSVTREATRQALVERDPSFAEKISLIPRYVDPEAVARLGMGEDLHMKYTQFRAILLTVAPLTREHNVHVAIDIVAKISEFRQNVGLVVVGGGYRKWLLMRYAMHKGVRKNVVFERMRDDLTSYYKSSFALIVSSLYEEYETVVEDALAAGCPVISSRVGMAEKLIQDKVNGYLCDPKVPSEYWNVVSAMIDNPHGYAQMRKHAAETVRTYMVQDAGEQMRLLGACWNDAMHRARGF